MNRNRIPDATFKDDSEEPPVPKRFLVLYVTQDGMLRRKVYEQARVREEQNNWVCILQDSKEIAKFREPAVESWEYTDDYPQG